MPRKNGFEIGSVHHIFNRSIAGYQIFSGEPHRKRFQQMLQFFQWADIKLRYSHIHTNEIENILRLFSETKKRRVDILAYCIMPNHFHLILQENLPLGISKFMADLQNSYSKYFNQRHKRKGPLWEGRFKNVRCQSDEQLLHLTRYIHLNPVTAGLVDKPEDWDNSSYKEYLLPTTVDSICKFRQLIHLSHDKYAAFVESHMEEQKSNAKIYNLILD